MNGRTRQRRLSSRDLTRILGVTSALAAPFDLMTMLGEVVAAAKQVLGAERGTFRPAELTGGDTFDLAPIDQGLLVVLADTTGHGIAPALSVRQMQAMLRIALRLGADLEAAFTQVSNRLADTLPVDRFITAFIGILEPATQTLRFHSGGQGPAFHFQAATRSFAGHNPTSFPLGAMPLARLKPAITLEMAPRDTLVLLSDGFYEYRDPSGELFGEQWIQDLVRDRAEAPMAELLDRLLGAVDTFARGAPQKDDMTAVPVRREPLR